MSIASKIVEVKQNMDKAYEAIELKGGTLPAKKCMIALDDSINTIPTGEDPKLDNLNVDTNGTYTPAIGRDGFNKVVVDVPETTLTTKNITENGTYNAPDNQGYNKVVVNVEGSGKVQNYKLFTVEAPSQDIYYPDSSYDSIKQIGIKATVDAGMCQQQDKFDALFTNMVKGGYTGSSGITDAGQVYCMGVGNGSMKPSKAAVDSVWAILESIHNS